MRFTIDGRRIEERTMVQWWRIGINNNREIIAQPLTVQESTQLVQWMAKHPENFPSKPTLSFGETPDERPPIEELAQIGLAPFDPPMFVLLRKEPKLKKDVYFVMDIKLKPKHEYDLPFDVVGELNPLN